MPASQFDSDQSINTASAAVDSARVEAATRKSPAKAHIQCTLYQVRTVADLMTEVLHHCYEARFHDPSVELVIWQ